MFFSFLTIVTIIYLIPIVIIFQSSYWIINRYGSTFSIRTSKIPNRVLITPFLFLTFELNRVKIQSKQFISFSIDRRIKLFVLYNKYNFCPLNYITIIQYYKLKYQILLNSYDYLNIYLLESLNRMRCIKRVVINIVIIFVGILFRRSTSKWI